MMKRSCGYLNGMLLGIFLSACASAPPANPRPAWIENPGNGVSASAGMNVRGRVAQEEAAIGRARVEYAKRFGVSIEAGTTTSTHVTNGQAMMVSDGTTQETTQQSDVKGMIKAKWHDEDADVIWVWLVPSN